MSDINYAPNIPGLIRVGLSAFGYGASYSIRSQGNDYRQELGQTSFTDFQLGFHNENWGIDGFYQTYKGFFIENSGNFGGQNNAPFLFPDLEFDHFALSARLSRDNKGGFILSNLLTQSEQIKNTAGTYFLLASLRHFSLKNTGTILPAFASGVNSDVDMLRKMSAHTLNIGAGAAKYWVSDSQFFFGANLDLIGTYGIYRFEREPTSLVKSTYITTSFNLKTGAGYSGQNFRAGVSISGEVTTLQISSGALISASANQVLAYLRYAF